MRKLFYLILALVFGLICYLVLLKTGQTAVITLDATGFGVTAPECEEYIEDPEGAVRIEKKEIRGSEVVMYVSSHSNVPRVVLVGIRSPRDAEDYIDIEPIYVHSNGILSRESPLGPCEGDMILKIAVLIYFLIMVTDLALQLKNDLRKNLYQYKNIKTLGLLIFFGSILLMQILELAIQRSLYDLVMRFAEVGNVIAYFILPIAFVLSIFVTATNIRLMRREGYSWRNMLGCILGILFLLGTILPLAFSTYLYSNYSAGFWDVHRSNSIGRHAELLVRGTVLVLVFYMECVLFSAIILSVIAAKRKATPDRDYIVIPGCMIRKDGTPTPLLKGRADRALELGRKQIEAGGKAPVYVPSGGKGADEVISEAECIGNYLKSQGIPEERILLEDRSSNTRENMRFSYERIKEKEGGSMTGVKTAFSTTNYHVFRSGVLAAEAGLQAQGVGSTTKAYFWINAFVREFIATMSIEWKTHAYIMFLLVVAETVLTFVVYYANSH